MKINKYEADYIAGLYNRYEEEEELDYFNIPDDEEVILESTYEFQLMQELEEEEYDRFLLKAYNIDSRY